MSVLSVAAGGVLFASLGMLLGMVFTRVIPVEKHPRLCLTLIWLVCFGIGFFLPY